MVLEKERMGEQKKTEVKLTQTEPRLKQKPAVRATTQTQEELSQRKYLL